MTAAAPARAAPPARLLVVEDDPVQRGHLAAFVRGLGHEATEAADADAARTVLDGGGVDVVLTDLRLPGDDGIALLRWARPRHPTAEFIVLTAHGCVETAVDAMRDGACDFLTKPLDLDALERRIAHVLARRRGAAPERASPDGARSRADAPGVVAESAGMRRVLALVGSVAPTNATVLVVGESGCGKEVVADLVHRWSRRAAGPYVRVNCAAFSESLLDAELFGHVRGAFTGAERDHDGMFVRADGGTLLLDEIGEISASMQVRLLRVLQEREVVPVGGTAPRRVDVRVVAATHRDLAQEIRAGRFRHDLYYRLNTVSIAVPPLRERPEDVEALAPMLLRRFAAEDGVAVKGIARDALDRLVAHPFPGNVRELQNVLRRAAILAPGDVLRAADVDEGLAASTAFAAPAAPPVPSSGTALPDFLAEIERNAMRQALARHGGVSSRAARALGMTERVFRYKLRQHGIGPTDPSES